MRQRQIIKEAAQQAGLNQANAKKAIDAFIELVSDELLNRNKLELGDFGTFSLLKVKEKNAAIPGKKEKVVIPQHYKLQYKTSEKLRSELQELPK